MNLSIIRNGIKVYVDKNGSSLCLYLASKDHSIFFIQTALFQTLSPAGGSWTLIGFSPVAFQSTERETQGFSGRSAQGHSNGRAGLHNA